MTKNEKISKSLKERFSKQPHHGKGAKRRPLTDEEKQNLSLKLKGKQRVFRSEAEKKARNKAKVYAYRARLRNAIPPDADLDLITKIYENCPDGYHVDHIIALADNGLHHQDNLQYLEISENCRKGKRRIYDTSKALAWKDFIPAEPSR